MKINGDYAAGRLKKGVRNKTEAAYEAELQGWLNTGEILWFKFEGFKLRLADGCTYSPDFVVMNGEGKIECHEVKGFWRDDARVKIKVAAEQFPFKFLIVTQQAKKRGGGWLWEEL